ncbi:hypothetical protein BTA51_09090 [Hahella sp. CCB-MM4]|uniref:cysteine hydrolase family protein n=1 Tax=Hahella sp. (strain CCB-MM4) TaxID=1926491 RepID=UPI000B9B08F6|nr:cysteine hydrolase family protein [Hahella sp. CCB-MM4]OZG73927.1 hypothetical protein BTA51_09090 [Hahella sp. CCB-MM4]
MFHSSQPALILIDVQVAIDSYSEHPRNHPDAEQKMHQLLQLWRERELPVFHVRHASKFPGSPYHPDKASHAFKPEVAPLDSESIVTKSENSAFIGTNLNCLLKSQGISELVICGVLTNNSVDATARVAAGYGYTCYLVSDAMAACGMTLLSGDVVEAEKVHEIFLSNLHGEYGTVCYSGDILTNLSESSRSFDS